MKLTGWFRCEPVHDGVYQCDDDGHWFRLFKNGNWYWGERTAHLASLSKDKLQRHTLNSPITWRGLAEKPK